MSHPESPLARLLGAVEDAIFPPVCGGCRKRGAWLCDACWAQVRYVPSPVCGRCGHPMQRAGDPCRWCRKWPSGLSSVRAAFVFEGAMRSSIHRFKYRGEHARGHFLGQLLADHAENPVARRKEPSDIVVAVPLHLRRRRARGFNQAEILAKRVAVRLGLPLSSGLIRTGKTQPQATLGRTERWENVKDAFQWKGAPLAGANVLLIDDVTTTGATLASAATVVMAAGAGQVNGLALAREV